MLIRGWVWAAWLATIALSFAVLESLSWHDVTFSRFMWNMTENWPLWAYLWGNLTGGLAVHFWWHWSPPGSSTEG